MKEMEHFRFELLQRCRVDASSSSNMACTILTHWLRAGDAAASEGIEAAPQIVSGSHDSHDPGRPYISSSCVLCRSRVVLAFLF